MAGVETNQTGFCILNENLNVETMVLYTDKEIIEKTLKINPVLVSIDAPLGLPRGRCCLRDDCSCRNAGHLRECDRILLRMRIKFFPVTLGPMRKLTVRGIKLSETLRKKGLKVIESFPNSIRVILGFPGKKEGIEKLRKALVQYGIKGDITKRKNLTEHELDAILSALVGKLYLEGKALEIGDPEEALMVIPNPKIYSYPYNGLS